MSHFKTVVFLKNQENLDDMMEEYDEGITVSPYIDLTKQQAIEKVRKEIDEYRNTIYAEYLADPKKYKDIHKQQGHIDYLEKEFPEKIKWTDEQCYQSEAEYYDDDMKDDDGNLYSTYNPKSKYDYYSEVKLDGNPSRIKVKDWNKYYGFNKKDYDKAIRFWEVVVEHSPIKEGENENEFFNLYNESYYLKMYETKENFAKKHAVFIPWSFVYQHQWHEQGSMGWWAMNDATKESTDSYIEKWNKIINDPKNQNLYMITLDCHI